MLMKYIRVRFWNSLRLKIKKGYVIISNMRLPMVVSINTLMVDGTGMCGACRIKVGDKTKFACVDGPEFDAHLVDFDEALRRQRLYFSQEQEADKKAGLDCCVKK